MRDAGSGSFLHRFLPSAFHRVPRSTARLFLALGSLSAALAVAAGAFGAHALADHLEPRLLEVWETAARYQLYHALGLVLVATLDAGGMRGEGRDAGGMRDAGGRFSGWAFLAGTLLFSGSLYAMALTGIRALGAITPFGGVCFIAGWLALAVTALRTK